MANPDEIVRIAEVDIGRIESTVSGGRATAGDVQRVYEATITCRTVPEIAETTGLDTDIVDECINVLRSLEVIAEESGGRICNVEAVCSLCKQFDKIRKLCK